MAVSHTEKIIAFCRLLMAATTVAIAVVDPQQPSYEPEIGYRAGGDFLERALLARARRARQPGAHGVLPPSPTSPDLAITLFTERGATPFFLLNIFPISSVSVRWGFAVAGAGHAAARGDVSGPGLRLGAARSGRLRRHRAHLVRPLYLIVLGYLTATR
jgi:hypothetical protein